MAEVALEDSVEVAGGKETGYFKVSVEWILGRGRGAVVAGDDSN